jgi:putative glutamine amidotransferase
MALNGRGRGTLLGWRFSSYRSEQEDLMGRPIIGITGELDAARWGDWLREAVISPVSYIRAVDRSGGAPVVLAPLPPPSVSAFIATLDGLVFAGGRDLDPASYDQQRGDDTDEPEHRRDRFELALMRAALEANVPFLAIGRGLHVLTIARGGTLTQHLPGHRADRARYTPHDVALGPDSFLGGLLGTRVMVPAAHHQAPYQLGPGLTVAGWSPDGEVTEALEVDGHRFGVGVHWHPEESDDLRLFAALVEAAAEPRTSSAGAAGAAGATARAGEASQAARKPVAVKPKAGARR